MLPVDYERVVRDQLDRLAAIERAMEDDYVRARHFVSFLEAHTRAELLALADKLEPALPDIERAPQMRALLQAVVDDCRGEITRPAVIRWERRPDMSGWASIPDDLSSLLDSEA